MNDDLEEEEDKQSAEKKERAGEKFKQRMGQTREAAMLGLNIKQAELLETGEI